VRMLLDLALTHVEHTELVHDHPGRPCDWARGARRARRARAWGVGWRGPVPRLGASALVAAFMAGEVAGGVDVRPAAPRDPTPWSTGSPWPRPACSSEGIRRLGPRRARSARLDGHVRAAHTLRARRRRGRLLRHRARPPAARQAPALP